METKYQSTNKTTLASRYNVSLQTFNKWLNMIPELNLSESNRILTPKQITMIVNHLGEPPD